MKKTKIVCTIGPASETVEILKKLILNGMNVARLNFSHGSHTEHLKRMEAIRQASLETGIEVAILLDTKGPEIRLGMLKDNKTILEDGQRIVLTVAECEGTNERIQVNYPGLVQEVGPGNRILIDDGLLTLEVKEVSGDDIICEVLDGGPVSSRKGVNIPGVKIQLPSITEQDVADIKFGIEQQVDFIAASFVREAADVLAIREILEEYNADIDIISKIENQAGVENIAEILKISDGIMVARGDLGVEIPAEEVPLVQKRIIEMCNQEAKPVITATQMLESMVRNPRPTRAEASDVANAIFDGTDAIMLSGETAAGDYPAEAVKVMATIAERAERALEANEVKGKKEIEPSHTITDSISYATGSIAADLGAKAIITSTKSGSTARMVSKYRPDAPIIAATPCERVIRKLLLVWGVAPIMVNETDGTDEMFREAVAKALMNDMITTGDLVVITAGVPVGVPGTTNLLKVHIVGEVLARGTGIGKGTIAGEVVRVDSGEEAKVKVREGDILITTMTDRDFMEAIEKAGAIVTELGGITSHAAIVAINMGKPVVLGIGDDMAKLHDGLTVTIDTNRGLIYRGITRVL
ncbi:MAG: pyruvate kinase [Bacillota bacterium]|nr:pyruvate kinase [Bacillota bacterium]